MKFWCHLLFICVLTSATLLAQEEYPVATPTDQPDVVISPFDPNRRLDVAGLEPGSLAEDPIAKKIFRIPYSNPTQRYYEEHAEPQPTEPELPPPPITTGSDEVLPPPPVDNKAPTPQPEAPAPSGPNSPSWVPSSGQVPQDLVAFLYAFNQNSTVNDPEALLPFYADRVDNYFGRKGISHSTIRKDRATYIERWPRREYIIDGAPVLLGQSGNTYEVMTRVRYRVSNGTKSASGAVSDYFKVRRGSDSYQIIDISEAKASAAPASIQQQDSQKQQQETPTSAPSDASTETIYSRFEREQINLFLDSFAAAGEVNDPTASLDFLHPNITTFFGMSSPTTEKIIKDRKAYIKLWPNRRYWLAEKPIITPLSSGSWDVQAKTGYEVRNGAKTSKGVAGSTMRLTHTPAGLKIAWIKSK